MSLEQDHAPITQFENPPLVGFTTCVPYHHGNLFDIVDGKRPLRMVMQAGVELLRDPHGYGLFGLAIGQVAHLCYLT